MENIHIMVDLETLGTAKTSIFTTAALVVFDTTTGQILEELVVRVDIKDAQKMGLTMDAGTVEWWLTQRPEIMRQMFEGEKETLAQALGKIREFIKTHSPSGIWGNAPSFDLDILTNAFNALRMVRPWHYSKERCYRTLRAMFSHLLTEAPVNNHDPLQDCKNQIGVLVKILNAKK